MDQYWHFENSISTCKAVVS